MTTKKAEKAARVAVAKWQAFARKVRTLTGHAAGKIDAAEMRAAFDGGKLPEDFAAEVASREPVGRALHPGKAEAVKHAADEARQEVERVRAELEAAGWDLSAAAPYPWRVRNHFEAEGMRQKHNHFAALTMDDPAKGYQSSGMNNAPRYVVMSDKGIALYIQRQERQAALYYDAFIVKMVAKVGEVTDASIEGSHVWSYSILTVTLPDGTVECWKTQQITNRSVLGLYFPQWPSRKMKGGA